MLRRESAGWLARLQGGRDPDVRRKFQEWRDADPRHAEAFDRVRGSYEQAGLLRHSPMADRVHLEPAVSKTQWSARPALAAAAAIVVLVPVGVALFRNTGLSFAGTDAVMLMTSVGEIKQVNLADGSTVTLDTSTKMEVEIGRSHRGAHLKYGRARFRIVRSTAPFVVETANSKISAGEGTIDVEQGALQDRIQMLVGNAYVRGSAGAEAAPVELGAGDTVTVSSRGPERKGVAPPRDWTHGMLQFDNMPLADAVALANRYSERHIVLLGDLDSLRVTGAFRAGDISGFSKALAEAFDLSLQQRPDGSLQLSRKVPPALQNKRRG